MSYLSRPPENLLAGRRMLENLKNFRLIQDFRRLAGEQHWVLHCALSITSQPTPFVPKETEWYVLVDDIFPRGEIGFFPSRHRGIKKTFQHQELNIDHPGQKEWTLGKLCLTVTRASLEGRIEGSAEPLFSNERLLWHFKKAQEWLEDAARGHLAITGDYYELPQFDTTRTNGFFGFEEDVDSYSVWKSSGEGRGYFQYFSPVGASKLIIARRFLKWDGKDLRVLRWGSAFDENKESDDQVGCWILLKQVPRILPWQSPVTWGDLKTVFVENGIDFDTVLEELFSGLRDKKKHLLLLGFPIPEKIGEAPVRIHWLCIELPVLSWGDKHQPGFRPSMGGHWMRDKLEIIGSIKKINWVEAGNLNSNEIFNRGRFCDSVRKSKTLIVGAGALGSVVSELLVRGGIERISICDNDEVKPGNLSRHVLTMLDIGSRKAPALAKRLKVLSPVVQVQWHDTNANVLFTGKDRDLTGCDLFIDTTGSDEILFSLEGVEWEESQVIVSISVGYAAKHLYAYLTPAKKFNMQYFIEKIKKTLDEEKAMAKSFPREGLGCWNNVFPARGSDISLMAAKAVNLIDRYFQEGNIEPKVFIVNND